MRHHPTEAFFRLAALEVEGGGAEDRQTRVGSSHYGSGPNAGATRLAISSQRRWGCEDGQHPLCDFSFAGMSGFGQ